MLMDEITAWQKATGTSDYRLGQLACANPYAVIRIRAGGARVETLEQVLAYIRDNPAKGRKKKQA